MLFGMRMLLCVISVLSMVACNSYPVIYDTANMQGDKPTGSVPGINQLLGTKGEPLRLIFLHSVGDHCPGYVLDPGSGWLNTKTAQELGLKLQNSSGTPVTHTIPLNVFMGGASDSNSNVQFQVRYYQLNLPGASSVISIQAIEVTWSNLTRWIKTDQLSYDSPSVFSQSPLPDCIQPPNPKLVPPIKNPPSRLWLDQIAKESVLDRELADAVIYAGTYSPVIQRGVAEALCRAIDGKIGDAEKCAWPESAAAAADPYRYIFVTHSLGGRILYDLLLNLSGHDTESKPNPFLVDGVIPDTTFASHMLSQTPAVYMMANQLSLIGLANISSAARSANGPLPYLEFQKDAPSPDAQAPISTPSPNLRHRDVLSSLAEARTEAIMSLPVSSGQPAPTLNIIAFNDTNDLLTWHVPSWYGNKATGDAGLGVRITNVFVRNAFPLLILKSPEQAHDGYFENKDVRGLILCGGAGRQLSKCQH